MDFMSRCRTSCTAAGYIYALLCLVDAVRAAPEHASEPLNHLRRRSQPAARFSAQLWLPQCTTYDLEAIIHGVQSSAALYMTRNVEFLVYDCTYVLKHMAISVIPWWDRCSEVMWGRVNRTRLKTSYKFKPSNT